MAEPPAGATELADPGGNYQSRTGRIDSAGTSVNAVLAFIEGAEPRNEVEAALAIQMACTHAVTMTVLERLGGGFRGDATTAVVAGAAARLLRAFATQVETLRRLRNGGSQVVRIEYVHVSDGSQAVIGNVKRSGDGEGDLTLRTSVSRDGERNKL